MELYEFHIREWQASSGDHGSSVSSAGMCRRASLISSSVASSSNNSVKRSDSMDGSVSNTYAGNTSANTLIINDKI